MIRPLRVGASASSGRMTRESALGLVGTGGCVFCQPRRRDRPVVRILRNARKGGPSAGSLNPTIRHHLDPARIPDLGRGCRP